MTAGYDTLIVTFSDPIKVLDNMFSDADAWGTDTLKGWVEDYESTRFTQINEHTAVITSEYNMPCSSFTSLREIMCPAISVTCGAWEYPCMTMTYGQKIHAPLPSVPLKISASG